MPMVSLARSSLLYEWRRYLPAVLAITFAGLLMVVQVALLMGLFATVSVVVDKSAAQLWIGFRDTQSVDLGRPLAARSDAAAWAHPGVERVERYVSAYGDLRRSDGVPITVLLNAVDTSDHALAFSALLTPQQRAMLREPGAILIDEADVSKLGARSDWKVEINGRGARIAGVVRGLRAVGGVNVVGSYATMRQLAPETAEQVTFHLVRLRPGWDPRAVAQDIGDRSATPRYSVWLSEDFSVRSQTYWLLESGTGIGSGFASVLALIVGIAITSQTLAAAVMGSIKEFAALRALGVSRGSLRRVVIEQSLWVGAVGLAVTALLVAGIAWLGTALNVAMAFSAWMLGGVAALMIAIAVASGVLALRPLLHAEPATLLR
jgi:putative ABC transport system permease protein